MSALHQSSSPGNAGSDKPQSALLAGVYFGDSPKKITVRHQLPLHRLAI
jgi:hypothetical protein